MPALLTVGWGIFVGLAWSRRTGWSCGGIITPGLLALYALNPWRGAFTLLAGVALTPVLSLCARAFGLYGRERSGAAMLLALCVYALLPGRGVGWVLSGLVAADSQRQGVLMTVCGAVSCAIFTVFSAEIFRAAAEAFL
jgi:hypothetical protein